MSKLYDALIIGAGPAGLSTALGLGRVHRTCAVFSDAIFRNQGAHAAHSILTRDHTPPEELRRIGREQIERYGNTTFIESRIESVRKDKSRAIEMFVAEDGKGQAWFGKTVVLATGCKDVFPDLPGYAENWPHNIFQCLFCDGHERAHLPSGILAYPTFTPMYGKMASMLHLMSLPPGSSPSSSLPSSNGPGPASSSLLGPPSQPPSSKVTLFTNGPLDPSDAAVASCLETCAAYGIRVDQRRVVKLVDTSSTPSSSSSSSSSSSDSNPHTIEVHLSPSASAASDTSATKIPLAFVVHKPATAPTAAHLIAQLQLATTESMLGDTVVQTSPPMNMTSEPGVFACGDASAMVTSVPHAMVSGMQAASAVAHWCGELDEGVTREAWRSGVR